MFETFSFDAVVLQLETSSMLASLDLEIPVTCHLNKPVHSISRGVAIILDLAVSKARGKNDDSVNGRAIQVVNGNTKSLTAFELNFFKPGTSFKIFPNLPIELRYKVWGMAIDECPREITIREFSAAAGRLDTVVLGATRPSMFLACKEVFHHVLTTALYKPMFQVRGRKAVFFNSEIDAVRMDSQWPNNPLHGLNADMVERDALAGIKRLHINGALIQSGEQWFAYHIMHMAKLDHLEIDQRVQTLSPLPEFDLHMSFGVAPGNSSHGLFILDEMDRKVLPRFEVNGGGYVYGMHAMIAIKEFVQDNNERQRLMDIWMLLGRLVKYTNKMPPRTYLNFCYHY